MATLPRFAVLAQQERADELFRQECADRAREYVMRVRARKIYQRNVRLFGLAVASTAATALFVGWQIASVVAWLLNN